MLVNRLKKVIERVVSSIENAFMEERQILDAILITSEAIDSILKSNHSFLLTS